MATIYGTRSGADSYHTERGNAAWGAASTGDRDAALILAAEWIDDKFGTSFPGEKTDKRDQEREWPRENAADIFGDTISSTAVPSELERAAYEVALRHIEKPGSLFVDWTPGKEKLSVAVSGAVSVTYAGAFNMHDAQLQIGKIGGILRPILSASAETWSLSGRSGRV